MKVEGQCLISEDGHIYDYSHDYEEKLDKNCQGQLLNLFN
jgi:hypothetical protein